ncbi:MAG: glycosyltransferase [Cyclobacteriaceae bacterium]|nr:glycosyltransferase [Cyclobacteriaceae bacterium]
MPGKSSALPPEFTKNIYLQRYAWPGPALHAIPNYSTKIIIVIPCYSEEKIVDSLTSLFACESPACHVEVIVVINFGVHETEAIKSFNYRTADEVEQWTVTHQTDQISVHIIRAYDLPEKHAGVGLARKIGMDEAVRRFESIGQKNGIIVCFDADCLCSRNYLLEVERFYRDNSRATCALLAFEHNLSTIEDERNRNAIVNYELHLRYYVQALKYAHFPYAYHTIGSCITLKSTVYQKQGGMNLRKAGEDFYFLQKLFPLGDIHNLTNATVYPSARPSHRVPFGTGRSILELMETKQEEPYSTYHPDIFVELRQFCDGVPMLWNRNYTSFLDSQSLAMKEYLSTISFFEIAQKIQHNATTEKQFIRSFYAWFNGFLVMKFVHYARDHHYGNMEIMEACSWILRKKEDHPIPDKKESMLHFMRNLDRLE